MRLKKRILCILVVLFCSLVGDCLNAFAKEKITFTEIIDFESETYVIYDLEVSENSLIAGVTIEINYDSRQLKLVKSEVGDVLKPTINKLNSQTDSTIILTAISTEAITKQGNILHLEFELLDESKPYVELVCLINECINEKCDELPFNVSSTKINNPLYSPADAIVMPDQAETDALDTGVSNQDKVQLENESIVEKDTNEKSVNDKQKEKNSTSKGDEQDEKNKESEDDAQSNIIICMIVIVSGTLLILLNRIVRRKKK